MNCYTCYDKGEIYLSTKDDFIFEYCECEAGYEKYEEHELFLLEAIGSDWYAGELFSTPEARQKGNKMSATALAIADASKQAMFDETVIDMAKEVMDIAKMGDEQMIKFALFQYSAQLTALTANLVTCVLLTEEQMDAMMSEISELEELGKEMN